MLQIGTNLIEEIWLRLDDEDHVYSVRHLIDLE